MIYLSNINLIAVPKNKLFPSFYSKVFSIFFFLLIIYFLFSSIALAAGGKVSALQMPAWLERDLTLSALKPGIILQTGALLKQVIVLAYCLKWMKAV